MLFSTWYTRFVGQLLDYHVTFDYDFLFECRQSTLTIVIPKALIQHGRGKRWKACLVCCPPELYCSWTLVHNNSAICIAYPFTDFHFIAIPFSTTDVVQLSLPTIFIHIYATLGAFASSQEPTWPRQAFPGFRFWMPGVRCSAWVRVLSKHTHYDFLKIRPLRQYYLHIKKC